MASKGEAIRIVLITPKVVGGVERDARFVMLQGVCNEGVTVADVEKALQLGQLTAVGKPREKVGAAEGET